ncbi:MAG: biotin carboxylase N-terminal domain-containing protein, partial [Aggregatilineales bacterium]
MLSSVLIANRGEIACRVIHACRELGLRAVAVYSAADRTAKHVQLADAAVLIGDAPPSASYLNIPALIDAAHQTGCDAVHPGYGFLSERDAFAQAVIDAGLTWVGPSPQAIAQMGVKTTARALMQAAGVPVVPGYQSEADDLPALIEAAQQVGFPLMVKAAGGGGGKGIRIVRTPDDLPEALTAARSEALKAFNDPRLFLERYIEHGRHIEVQILGDHHGTLLHLYERDCSTQRRHQKIIEESPSPFLSAEQRERIGEIAVRAGRAVNYVNAGTVEMIATPQGELFFLEMNTRVQVEHPVTELVTGLDLVKWQLRIAAGERLPFTQAQIKQRGHAIECRLYAEDPQNGFLPAVG